MKKLLVILSIAAPAFGANLLQNATFDANLTGGWASSNTDLLTAAWSGMDANGSATSGSAILRNTDPVANGAGPTFDQCVAVTAGATYGLSAKFHIAPNQNRTGYALGIASYYSGPNCTGTFITNAGASQLAGGATGRFVAAGSESLAIPAGTQSARVGVQLVKNEPGGVWEVSVDDVVFAPAGGCIADLTTLCLGNNRFKVTAFYETATSQGFGRPFQLSSDTGSLWFFGPENIELIVKVLNGCGANSRYWVFSGGLTNVGVTLTVEDTVAHKTKTYTNPINQPFAPIQDTGAFNTCP